ncbi:MAG: hypothetical protein H6558_15610 [Lewinellaceae bacterium]|nr:hypothetical protein [Lewinellaceae bacterium]MCB9291514.1 hypothetical protein [Lewinellaceae bacterium]
MNLTFEETTGLEKQLQLLIQKLGKLREQHILIQGTDAAREFLLDNQIVQAEQEAETIKQKLAARYNIYSQEGESLLAQKVAELNIEEELGAIHRVDCDRREMRRRFWKAFEEQLSLAYHYYFISACLTQMPPSFAERMIYELIHEELDDDEQGILCLRRDKDQRVQIQPLPLRRNLAKSQQEFRAFFARHFEFSGEQEFDTFLRTGLPRLPYRYVAMVFELHEGKWEDFLPEYFQWIIDAFSSPNKDVPSFVFFFVLYVDNLHREEKRTARQNQIVQALQAMETHNRSAVHLSPLQPVPVSDLQAWILDRGERNAGRIEELINLLARGLPPEDQEQYHLQQLLNMDDIERLQEIVYKKAKG